MKQVRRSFSKEPVITLMPDVTFAQVPFWFYGTQRPLKMDILLPKHRDETVPQPAIVWICGGAFQQVDRHIWIGEMLWFAKHGFTVASVEYRTSMEAAWPAQIIDVKSAVRYLRAHAKELCINPKQIAVMGESAGGYLANMVGVTGNTREFDQGEWLDYSSAVQAVVDLYGITQIGTHSVRSMANEDIDFIKGDVIELLMGGPESKKPEAYQKAVPFFWIHKNCPPFLILHGDQDPLVDIDQSSHLYETLTHAGISAEFDIFEGIGHGADEFYQEETKQRISEFLHHQLNHA